MSSTIQIRVDDELKIKSDKLFKELTKKGRIFLWTNSSVSVFLF
jgi:hypothetical protein